METIYGIIKRKIEGIDCTETESAEIKGWLRELKLPFEQPTLSEIQLLFPLEYGEFLDEVQIKDPILYENTNTTFYSATQDGNLLTTKRPTFYQANLVLVAPHKVSEITKGQSIAERLGDEEGKCPECGKNKWWLLPKECVVVRTGGKPYIECLECGYTTHL